ASDRWLAPEPAVRSAVRSAHYRAGPVSAPQIVDREDPRAGRREIEKGKAQQYRHLAVVLHRPEGARRMHEEVDDRHLPRQDECYRAREQPGDDEQPADELERAGDAGQREADRRGVTTKHSEELLSSMLPQDSTGEDPQEHVRPPGGGGNGLLRVQV